MASATHSDKTKFGFWKNLGVFLAAMDTTEADPRWDEVRFLAEENAKLKTRIDALESTNTTTLRRASDGAIA